jgi:hypothetical protein
LRVLTAVSLLASACVPYTQTTRYSMHQTGYRAPADPTRAIGRPLRAGEMAAEGHWVRQFVGDAAPISNPNDNQDASVIAEHRYGGLLRFGLGGGVDLDFFGDLDVLTRTSDTARQTPPDALDDRAAIGSGGFQLRGFTAIGERTALGMHGGARLARVVVSRTTFAESTTVWHRGMIDPSDCVDTPSGASAPARCSDVNDVVQQYGYQSFEREELLRVHPFFGASLRHDLTDWLALTAGLHLELSDYIDAWNVVQETCQGGNGLTPQCTGKNPSDVPYAERLLTLSGFAGLEVRVAAITLLAGARATRQPSLVDPASVPYGLRLGLRYEWGTPRGASTTPVP